MTIQKAPQSGVLTIGVLFSVLLFIKRNKPSLSLPLLLDSELEKQSKYVSFSVSAVLESASEASARISDFCVEADLLMKQGMQISMRNERGRAGR